MHPNFTHALNTARTDELRRAAWRSRRAAGAGVARSWHSLIRRAKAARSASAEVEARFHEQRAHDDALLLRYR
jgi:hypothetical protein